MATAAFTARGSLLLAPAAVALVASAPTHQTLGLGLALAVLALGLRSWAFAHLGGAGRTRDPSPPLRLVQSGPYRWFPHPVYLANCGLGLAMLVAAAPGWPLAAGLGLGLTGFYWLLAWREAGQLAGVPQQATEVSWRRVPRWERSTWGTTGLYFGLLLIL